MMVINKKQSCFSLTCTYHQYGPECVFKPGWAAALFHHALQVCCTQNLNSYIELQRVGEENGQ